MSNLMLENRLERYKKLVKQLRIACNIFAVIIAILVVALVITRLENEALKQQVKLLIVENQIQLEQYTEQIETMETGYLKILHSTSDWKALVYLAQGEAGGEGLIGIKHVVSTVVNRLETKHWGDTINSVISAPRQYCAYGITYKIMNPEVIQAVDEVLLYGAINDAIFYMNPKYSASRSIKWMRTKPYLLTYGNHEFYGG